MVIRSSMQAVQKTDLSSLSDPCTTRASVYDIKRFRKQFKLLNRQKGNFLINESIKQIKLT